MNTQQLYIPRLGDKLELAAIWDFDLYVESRNTTMWAAYGLPTPRRNHNDQTDWFDCDDKHQLSDWEVRQWNLRTEQSKQKWYDRTSYIAHIAIPAGEMLTVDRIYVKKNNPNFDSLSFLFKRNPNSNLALKGRGRIRFWAKIADVNKMVISR